MEMQPILCMEHVSHIYRNGVEVPVLQDINLSVEPGQFIAICGPSGSGKSTLLNLVGTLDIPTTGSVTIRGINTQSLKGDALADFRLENIGFVFQSFHLLPTLSALENVMLPLLPHGRRIGFNLEKQARTLIEAVGLSHRMNHTPAQLSGGEQQRVAIARALVNTPQILLADEPTGNLDSRTSEEILALLKRINQERDITILMVTHNEHITGMVDRILYLQDGQIKPPKISVPLV